MKKTIWWLKYSFWNLFWFIVIKWDYYEFRAGTYKFR